jgi:hypothetical protein
MRYFVRNQRGEELIVPSLADLHGLYSQGFLEDDDYVRAESADRWVKAGRMPALAGVRLKRREPGNLLQVLLLAAIGVAAVVTGAYRNLGVLGLVLLVALVSHLAWSRWRR